MTTDHRITRTDTPGRPEYVVWLGDNDIGVIFDEGTREGSNRGRYATWSLKATGPNGSAGFYRTRSEAADAIRALYEPAAPVETVEVATQAPEPTRSYTVTYTGGDDPIVHATGCSHTTRDSAHGTLRTEIVTGDLTAVAAHVYEDFICEDDGDDPANWVTHLRVKNCAR